jgi:multicomponent Na+:H+ antiporter subunit C
LILIGYRRGGVAPILLKGMSVREIAEHGVDPLPQALVLTSIVIGLGVLALMVAICLRLYEKYKTFDMSEINRLRG